MIHDQAFMAHIVRYREYENLELILEEEKIPSFYSEAQNMLSGTVAKIYMAKKSN